MDISWCILSNGDSLYFSILADYPLAMKNLKVPISRAGFQSTVLLGRWYGSFVV